jgi:leucine dehydrogenase
LLKDKGILYAPDYAINAGGLINVYNELEGYNRDKALQQTAGIFDVIENIISISEENNIPTHAASREIAINRINSVSQAKRIRIYRDQELFKMRNL